MNMSNRTSKVLTALVLVIGALVVHTMLGLPHAALLLVSGALTLRGVARLEHILHVEQSLTKLQLMVLALLSAILARPALSNGASWVGMYVFSACAIGVFWLSVFTLRAINLNGNRALSKIGRADEEAPRLFGPSSTFADQVQQRDEELREQPARLIWGLTSVLMCVALAAAFARWSSIGWDLLELFAIFCGTALITTLVASPRSTPRRQRPHFWYLGGLNDYRLHPPQLRKLLRADVAPLWFALAGVVAWLVLIRWPMGAGT